jgi:hypothetical protein
MSNWVLAFNLSDILYLREYIPWNSPYDCCCEQFIKKLNLDLFQKLEALALDNDFVTTHFTTKWDIEDNYRGITELLKIENLETITIVVSAGQESESASWREYNL